jgi:hypothetical protein
MKQMSSFSRVLIAMVLSILLGCGDSSSRLIGKWDLEKAITPDGEVISPETHPDTFYEELGKGIGIEFFNDNTFRYQNGSGGKWNIVNDKLIKLEMTQGEFVVGTIKENTLMINVMAGKFIYRKRK